MSRILRIRTFGFLNFILGFLLLAAQSAFAQTTITSGTTVNATAITAGNTVTIHEGGTLNMEVSRSFASITTSFTGAGTPTINGTGTLTVTGAVTIIGTTTLSLNVACNAVTLTTNDLSNETSTISGTGTLTL